MRQALPDNERCSADIRIGQAKHDFARCMRRKSPGKKFCKQHDKLGGKPARRAYRRTPSCPDCGGDCDSILAGLKAALA